MNVHNNFTCHQGERELQCHISAACLWVKNNNECTKHIHAPIDLVQFYSETESFASVNN